MTQRTISSIVTTSSVSHPNHVGTLTSGIPPLPAELSADDKADARGTKNSTAGMLASSPSILLSEDPSRSEASLLRFRSRTIRTDKLDAGSRTEAEAGKRKKKPSFLRFLTVREPSAQAFAEYQDSMKKQQQSKGCSRPAAIGMAMVSSSKLPAEVPKVNSKWNGVPDSKKKPKPSSPSSVASSISGRSSSRASCGSRGPHSSTASTFSFSTFSKLGSESRSTNYRENGVFGLWGPPPPSSLTPSTRSLPALSPGSASTYSIPLDSPLEVGDEFVHAIPLGSGALAAVGQQYSSNLSAPQFETESPLSTPLTENFAALELSPNTKTQHAHPSSRSNMIRPKSPFNPSRNRDHDTGHASSIPLLPPTNISPEAAATNTNDNADRAGAPRTILKHSVTGASRYSSREWLTPASKHSESPDHLHRRPTIKRNHDQQKAFEKVAPWEGSGFSMPAKQDADVEKKKSRAKSLFKA
ncbi:MAG: hypothetical protein MMC23_009337 [Stictis urceolatum]|nr:hypothetical protein [Stictis urceolata]